MKYTLAVISTLSILLPIVLNLWVYKKASMYIRLFLFFLLVCFFTDTLGWYRYEYQNESNILNLVSQFLNQAYPLIEVLFFLFFLWSLTINKRLKKILKFIVISVVPNWLIYKYFISFFSPSLSFSFFDAFYGILISFFASFILLDGIERSILPNAKPLFWILTGIFFYNFSTFFIMIFKEYDIRSNLWFIHNSLNITTNLIYSIGFFSQLKSNEPFQAAS